MEKKPKSVMKELLWILFVVYCFVLIYFLFLSERYGRVDAQQEYRYNLVLLKEIRRYFTYREVMGNELFYLNIFGNITAFMPFGFFLPILWMKKHSVIQSVLLSFELSLAVELFQLLFKVGSFDVDDILLNTIGGFLGYICFVVLHNIGGKKKTDDYKDRTTEEG